MTWEEFFKLVACGLFAIASGVIAFHAKGIMAQLKALTDTAHSLEMALSESAAKTGQLVRHVERLDKENTSLRRAHDALTRYLIGKGILSPPDPSTLNDV